MKCSKCGIETDKLFHQGGTHLCESCLMTNTHIFYKPIKCRVCDSIITDPLSLLNENDNARFCSIECVARAAGFYTNTGSN
jgi:NMD protein affecting ribosome stability and mRNA decay